MLKKFEIRLLILLLLTSCVMFSFYYIPPTIRGKIIQEVTLNKVQKMRRTVVLVNTDLGRGSGVVVSSSGLIITNVHVVDGAKNIFVRYGLKRYLAKVVYYHHEIDIAFLKIQANTPNYTRVYNKLSKHGDEVYAIGSPLGIENFVSKGITSKFILQNGKYPLIFTDATITNGSSGGALFNKDGELIGITTWTRRQKIGECFSNTGISLAISSTNFAYIIKILNKKLNEKSKIKSTD